MTIITRLLVLSALLPVLLGAGPARAGELPLIDAHSQLAAGLDPARIIPLMDEAGVRATLLSARNDRRPIDVLALAAEDPGRIIPLVRTKGKPFNDNLPGYYAFMKKQLANPAFRGMAEILLFHARKGNKAPEISVRPGEEQAAFAIDACVRRGWPVVVHIEFAAAGSARAAWMRDLEALLAAHPAHPFVLIHMGQLGPDEAARLLGAHPNLHFMTSHCNPVAVAESGQPWVNLFEGDRLAPAWRALIEARPDRFVLAFDNVWPEHWGPFYLRQARLWRAALSDLPDGAAQAVAHGNAERLWSLPPVR